MIKRDLYYERIPTKSLREDVRYLGDILGRVIKKQEGQIFFKLVEDTRLLSKANLANKHVKNPFKNIFNKINNLNPENTFKLARAFNHFMNFINLSETTDASRKLDEYENDKKNTSNKNIFIEEIFEKIFKDKKSLIKKFMTLQKN